METRCLCLLLVCVLSLNHATADSGSVKKMKMQYTGMPLLKFQICVSCGYRRVFEEYSRVLTQRYPDIRIEGENFLPQPIYRHIASFLSVFKLALIGLIILGKDPFTFFHMETPGIWLWAQENKIYACMMVFFLSNMIENQCMSTGAFEITLNDVPVWSKLQSGHLPSMQQLVQILENEMKLSAHMDSLPHRRA
uniref:Selenoprotein T n=1 Tax=Sinocyclocheilus anshuiensis TaxID=1608454 RepID=A0A671LTI6_9TELE